MMKRIDRSFWRSALVLALMCLPVAGFPQEADKQTHDQKPLATLHVQAREVLLPVTVRDKKGALVTTLQKSDFTLTEDGRPQTIKSFTRETNLPFQLGLLVVPSRSVSGARMNARQASHKLLPPLIHAE